jgi:single-stranded-DNA-specific exonuclease
MTLRKHLQRRSLDGSIEALHGLHPLLARIYAARGVSGPNEIEYSLKGLEDVWQLLGIEAAVERLIQAIADGESVMILGDFDADGATSTAVAIRGLRAMGLEKIDYLVPNRFEFGYGLTPEIVEVAAQTNPSLIVTVDNGISSVDGVERARELGIDVLVTDHHLPGERLPDAVAIVNPNQPGDTFPSKFLAGVGVMFYLLIALRQRLRKSDWFAKQACKEPNLASLLDLVALGTVADVVPLDRNNRTMVEQGLSRIRNGRCAPGITALLRCAGRDPTRAIATDLGFFAGPRLNAAGRLDDMSLGIECLLTDDTAIADRYARELDALNRERREIEASMQAEALASLDKVSLDNEEQWGLSLFQEGWHQGIVGLVAARIRERVHRPVIAFAEASEGLLKGSGRSIPGLHIRDALARVNSLNPDLIDKFGGHAMAAGLSLAKENLQAFSAAFDGVVRSRLAPEQLEPIVYSDGELQAVEFNLEIAELLRQCGPWGQAFPEPVFDGRFEILQQRVLKGCHLKYELALENSAQKLAAIVFNINPEEWPGPGERLHIAFSLDVNCFRNSRSVQLLIRQRFNEQ